MDIGQDGPPKCNKVKIQKLMQLLLLSVLNRVGEIQKISVGELKISGFPVFLKIHGLDSIEI